jgi:hypothetical protein
VFKQQIELTELMGAKAPQELMLASKQVFYFGRYVKGLAPVYQMMRDLYLTKNKIRRRRTSPLSGGCLPDLARVRKYP